MKAASTKEIKTELTNLHPTQLLDLCMQLTKYKKENKELLTYLLFEAHNEKSYIQEVTQLIDEEFKAVNKSNLYLAKKTVRKVLRTTQKHIKYSGIKQTEVELLIYFCKKLQKSKIPLHANTVLGNMYNRQLLKIGKSMATLHEDLQFDYSEDIKLLLG